MTTPDQSKGGRSRDEVLAGEYVLGVLSSDARLQVETRLKRDRQFAAIVHRWEENLSHFQDDYLVAMPGPQTYSRVEARLFPPTPAPKPGLLAGVWHSAGFWRMVSLLSLIVLVNLVAVEAGLFDRQTVTPALVASMPSPETGLSLVARFDGSSGRLRVTPVAITAEDRKSLELWLIDDSKVPRSLGVLPDTGEGEIIVPQAIRAQLKTGVTLAVSVEPFGGSPSGSPTGKVIATGAAKSL